MRRYHPQTDSFDYVMGAPPLILGALPMLAVLLVGFIAGGSAMGADKKLQDRLIGLTLSEFVALAGGSIADWSRWISGARDVRISSLFEPAMKLGLTPGELLDVILERRRRLLQQKMQVLEAQMHRSLPKNDFTFANCKQFGWNA